MSQLFENNNGFCPDCGSILPPLKEKGGVTCYACSRQFQPEVFGQNCVKTRIHFNSRDAYAKKDDAAEEDEGPIVERKCPKCGNDKMSYATLQLRSADEGQTVFYTCTECKYKESENS
ncbi:DNA-directed RNA polymerase I subunit RPA12 [Aethina tumida]|uniref:DNA-directed RNA polymerase I subunit RPA12 n=1 Tax=Aethina tumida TaxID=116153 RepID=UPI00096B239A|nr:DNA-directed RNA polymerase I subunit RPA12 [Aethina tumida]